MSAWTLRPERDGDEPAIANVITAAFAGQEWSDGTEAAIVGRLRASAELDVSHVAVTASGSIVGHVAFSPVEIDGNRCGWFGLGPLAVLPAWSRRGIGAALVQAGVGSLRQRRAAGCVVLGEPEYYGRFGFVHDPALSYPGPPAEFFQRLLLRGEPPRGVVGYTSAFG
jgi:putative acetyltransferase